MGAAFPFQFGLQGEDLHHFATIWHQNTLQHAGSTAPEEEHELFSTTLLPLQYDDFQAADDAIPTGQLSKKRCTYLVKY